MRRLRPFLPLGLALMIAIVAGCTGDPRATVKDKVMYKDKPVTGGTVVFLSEDGAKVDRVTIQPDGTYSSATVPIGNAKVAVEPVQKGAANFMPKSAKFPKDMKPPAKSEGGEYVDIPQKLRNPDSSGIIVKIEPGDKTWEIQLKDPK